MPVDKRVVLGLLVVLIIGAVAVYFLNKKKQTPKSGASKNGTSKSNDTSPKTVPSRPVSKPVISGHYYLQSVSTNLFLDLNGKLQNSKNDADSFYINVDTNVMDPEPNLNIVQSNIPGTYINIYLTVSGGILGITSADGPVYYIPVGITGDGDPGMVAGDIIPIHQAESQNKYLFNFVPK
jgi:hypothetical protein